MTTDPITTPVEWEFESLDSCIVCGGSEFTDRLKDDRDGIPLSFVRCHTCSALVQNPRPTVATLRQYFSSEVFFGSKGNQPSEKDTGYYDYEEWEASYASNAGAILGLIAKHSAPPVDLLEIGSATGWFLHAAQQAGYRVSGMDISQALADKVVERYQIPMTVESVEETALPDASFGVICNFGGIACWNNPQAAFENLLRLLKPGGIFCFNYTDHESLVARLRGDRFFEFNHASLVIHSRDSMHHLLDQFGLRILLEKTQWQHASVSRILSYLKLSRMYRLAMRLKIGRWCLRVPAVGTRLVVCQKA